MVTAEELQAFRERHGLSVRRLAKLVGVSRSTIQRWLEGEVQSQDSFREQALRRVMRRLDSQRADGP